DRTNELQLSTAEAQTAKQQAETANRIKSQFLASMSHELRTPLNAILNFTQFVASGTMGEVNPEQVEMLNNVVTSGHHLLSLINDILDISKIESGNLKLFVESGLEPAQIVSWVAQMGEPLIENKAVKLNVDVQPDLPAIVGDVRRIRQILLNL